MQKIALTSIAIIALVLFYFIQKGDNKIDSISHNNIKTNSIAFKEKEALPLANANIDTTFAPSISMQDIKHKVSDSTAMNQVEPKNDLEMQKIVLLDIQERIATEMKNIPNCLENANNKEEALQCNQQLQKIHKEFELLLGINNNIAPANTNDFVWNETTKENMIKELEDSIQPMQEMHTCIQTAETEEEQDKCFEVDESEEDTITP